MTPTWCEEGCEHDIDSKSEPDKQRKNLSKAVSKLLQNSTERNRNTDCDLSFIPRCEACMSISERGTPRFVLADQGLVTGFKDKNRQEYRNANRETYGRTKCSGEA